VISGRYAAAVLVLAVLALVPTVIHSYARILVDDGRSAAAIPARLGTFSSVTSTRNASWGKRRFDSNDWFERQYTNGRDEITLTVIRSYDLKALYHHPELAVAYHQGHTFQPEKTVVFPQKPAVPVHVLRAAPPDPAVSMYVLQYDGRFVEDPVTFQLRTAFELLFSGRKPMTLFFVQDASVPAGNLADEGITQLLLAAVDRFAAQGSSDNHGTGRTAGHQAS